ncbi:MAG: Fur family transcriptional regulator [Fervidobacterium sp.]
MRMTKNRQNVYNLISNSEVPLTAYEISHLLPHISLTTVYRSLEQLVETGSIRYFVLNNFKYYYVNSEHRHFFQCTKCRRLFSVDECYMEPYEKKIEEHFGFKVSEHFVFFTGLCRDCQKEVEV